jgi:hypothetical protein
MAHPVLRQDSQRAFKSVDRNSWADARGKHGRNGLIWSPIVHGRIRDGRHYQSGQLKAVCVMVAGVEKAVSAEFV